MVEQRLDAEAVAGDDDLAIAQIEQDDRPHAVEAAKAVAAPLHVGREDHLGVADGCKAMTELRELLSDLAEIVDLAVEHQPDRAVGRRHRLGGRLSRILDLQPAERHPYPQSGRRRRMRFRRGARADGLPIGIQHGKAFAIGTAVGNPRVHGEHCLEQPLARLEVNDGAQPAHSTPWRLPWRQHPVASASLVANGRTLRRPKPLPVSARHL